MQPRPTTLPPECWVPYMYHHLHLRYVCFKPLSHLIHVLLSEGSAVPSVLITGHWNTLLYHFLTFQPQSLFISCSQSTTEIFECHIYLKSFHLSFVYFKSIFLIFSHKVTLRRLFLSYCLKQLLGLYLPYTSCFTTPRETYRHLV